MDKNYEELKKTALELGACCFGVADIREIKYDCFLPKWVVKNLNYGVSIAVRLSKTILSTVLNYPTKIYFHHYRTVNYLLDQIAIKIVKKIQDKGYNALPIPASQTTDWEHQRADFSHKKVAILAGIGWLGRNNLVVHPKYGAQIRLVTILTDIPLKTDSPLNMGCGECRRCIPVCPVGAIKENPRDFDHIKCYQALRNFVKKGYVGQYICGICLRVCDGRRSNLMGKHLP